MRKLRAIEFSNKLVYILLFSIGLLFLVLILISEGFFGGGDSIAHYRISRYAFKYPFLFLDHWGKPVFTALSSPFSQLGFMGIQFYNLTSALITGWFVYRILKILKEEYALLGILFMIFTPLYFVVIFSGLTEITFGLVLMAALYYWFKEKPALSAILISFIPFVRTEGILIVLLFLLGFALFKRARYIPLFFTGLLVLSFSGWNFYDDFFWVIHRMPYTGAREIYGSGSVFHFIKALPEILGWPILLLMGLGIFSLIYRIYKKQELSPLFWQSQVFIMGSLLVYFAGHSYVWWKGMGGSLGLTRVMVGIIPLFAIIAAMGYSYLTKIIKSNPFINYILPALTLILVLLVPFGSFKMPMKLDAQHRVLKEAALWVKSSPHSDMKIYYHDLFFLHSLGVDPYDTNSCHEKIPNKEHPEKGIEKGSIIQWDAHYGPNEGSMPLERLTENDNFEVLEIFEPEYPFTVLGGLEYQVVIFIRK